MASGYERQIGPGGSPDIGGISLDAAMGTGAAIARAGGELGEIAQREKVQKRADEASTFGVRSAGADQRIDDLETDLQANLAEGGEGYVENVRSALDTEEKALFAGITDERVLARARESWAEKRSTREARANAFQVGAQIRKRTADNKNQVNIHAARAGRLDDEADVLGMLSDFADTLEEQPGAEDTKDAVLKDASGLIVGSWLQGISERSPERAVQLLDSGRYDKMLEPAQLVAIRSHAGVVQRRNESEANAAAAQLKAQQREQLQTAEATLQLGTGNPADWTKLADRWAAIGDDSKAVQARAKAAETSAAIGYRGATPAQLDLKLAELDALEAKNGGLTAGEASLRRGLQGVRKTVSGLIAKSPLLANSFSTGAPPPAPINWSDPASIGGRLDQARAAARRYGQVDVKPLLPDDIEDLQDVYAKEGGKAAVLDRLRLFGDEAGSAARQVAPSDPAFIHLADLAASGTTGRAAMADVLAGEKALKTAPRMWSPGVKSEAVTAWNEIAPMFATSPALGTAIFTNARAIYAAESIRDGDVDQNGLDEERWSRAIDRAAGGDGAGRGGVGEIHGAPVIVPEAMGKEQFSRLIARAEAATWLKAANGRTPILGGKPATLGALRGAVPVALGGGRYGLRIGNGRVTTREGASWTFDPFKLIAD